MKRSWQNILGMVLIISLTFGAGYFIGGQDQEQTAIAQDDGTDQAMEPFWETWELLHQFYVDPLDDEALVHGAIDGMLASLEDPHMSYIPPDDYEIILTNLNAEFEGIGATVRQDEETGALVIVRPLPDSPALEAGILAGDQIVTVDGEDITELDQDVIISMVRGPAGTDVILGVRRAEAEDLLEITVTRGTIVLPTVEYEILDGNIGYLQLYQFSPDTNTQVTEALIDMDANNLEGLIVDLRGNSGGYLNVALDIISEFIEEGPILIERGAGDDETVYEAFGHAHAADVPLVVLVDQGSASASELMAGALQDRGRATIIGMPTFGKGSVQTWRRLSNDGGVRITISRWFTPAGYSVEPDGIQPDEIVEFSVLEEGEVYSQEIDTQLQAAIDELVSVTTPRA